MKAMKTKEPMKSNAMGCECHSLKLPVPQLAVGPRFFKYYIFYIKTQRNPLFYFNLVNDVRKLTFFFFEKYPKH